jgi:hypothetical protein
MLDKISEILPLVALAGVFILIYFRRVDIVIEFNGNAIKIISK